MARWTIEQMDEMNDFEFASAILKERRSSTTNAYSPLNQKISKAINTLDEAGKKKREEDMSKNK